MLNMKNKSRIFALICALMLIFTVLPSGVSAAPATIYINAENVVSGGQNVGYYDTSASGTLESPWVSATYSYTVILRGKEWVKYEVKAPAAGEYTLLLRYGKGPNGTISITAENQSTGEVKTGSLDGTETYYGSMQDVAIGKFNLKAGKNVIVIKDPGDAIYMDMVILEPVIDKSGELDFSAKEGPYIKHFLPCVVEGEDYDIGTTGSKSADGKNNKGKYRKNDPLDIDEISKNSNEYYLILNSDEYANYTVECEYTDVYNLSVDLINEGTAQFYIDDCEQPIELTKAEKGESTLSQNVYLKKGTHVVKVQPKNGEISLDKFSFTASENYENVFDPENAVVKEDVVVEESKNEVYKELYVSENGSDDNDGSKNAPYKTIAKAKETVRTLRDSMTGDIYVYIEPGYYKQLETLTFDPQDGGKDNFNVIYKGATPFKESVIGGGTHITGWEKTDNEIYKAHFDSENDIRNLYVNDVPAFRARTKYTYKPTGFYTNEGSKYNQDGMTFNRKNFPTEFYDPSRMECWWIVEWNNYYTPIKDITYEEDSVRVEMEQPYFGQYDPNGFSSPIRSASPTVFINDLTLLDEPGEFYFDMKNKTIYYFPREGETLDNVYAGETEILIKADGTPENKIKNLYFERLSFKHGAYYETNTGISTSQADIVHDYDSDRSAIYTGKVLPGQVAFNHVDNVRVTDCHFVGLGSCALSLYDGVINTKVIGNVFNDISGSAVSISNFRPKNIMPEGMERCKNIEFSNNLIRRVSYEYRASPAITNYYSTNVTISHNDIEDVPYSGISNGWGWGEFDNKEDGNHNICYNRIVNVMDTHDGAHIYTLGPCRGTKIYGNYLWKTLDYRGGIYLDEGSGYYEVYNNVVGGSGDSYWFYGRPNARLSNNVVHDNFSDTDSKSVDEKNVNYYSNKVEKAGANGNWSAEAQAIIDNAGLEDAYSHLYAKAEILPAAANYVKTRPNDTFKGRNEWVAPGGYINYFEPKGLTPNVYASGDIGDTEVGEWEEYEVPIFKSGKHKFIIQAGTAVEGTELRLTVDGEVLIDNLSIPQNDDKSWATHEIEGGEYYLEKGTHIVRIEHAKQNFMFGPFKFVNGDDLIASDPEYDEGKLPSEILAEEPCPFDDLKTHWSKENVLNLYDAGHIKGVSETLFAPDREITLYETLLLAMRVSGEDETKWTEKLTELGLSDKIATANNAVTREEFCDVIMKFYAQKTGPYNLTADYNAYSDFSEISEKYYSAVWGAKTAHLMSGDTAGNFNPKNTLTRGEAATVIDRFSALIN